MPHLRPILLAEDNPNDIELTLSALHGAHLANEVVVVRDGVCALDWLYRRGKFAQRATLAPAVVILDLKMPRIGGTEVLGQIRSDPDLRTLPVVILTSSREESDIVCSYGLGVNAYVVKPVVCDSFVSAVSQLGVFWAVLNEPPPVAAPPAT